MLRASRFFDPGFVQNILNLEIAGARKMTHVRKIGFLVYPDAEILDVCGPLDAFVYADRYLRGTGRTNELGYETQIIATTPGPIKTKCGLEIVATHGLTDVAEGLDTLIVTGGEGVVQACAESELVGWVKKMAARARRIVSICTGAFLLAEAGLLRNRRVRRPIGFCPTAWRPIIPPCALIPI
ncbi:MAG: DJ-1/PfpI family protein [Alphaproteobacteria bacterium]|nr:DJ-1/PfpI family protein [Alphaproteobacteria bacterium]